MHENPAAELVLDAAACREELKCVLTSQSFRKAPALSKSLYNQAAHWQTQYGQGNYMEATTAVQQKVSAHAMIVQMTMGAWVTKVISETTRLGVPDLVKQHGPLRAADMVTVYGLTAVPDALERVLRACASLGIFTEDATGKFGLTELSEVLTSDSPASLKKVVEAVGGTLVSDLYRAFRRSADRDTSGADSIRHGLLELPEREPEGVGRLWRSDEVHEHELTSRSA